MIVSRIKHLNTQTRVMVLVSNLRLAKFERLKPTHSFLALEEACTINSDLSMIPRNLFRKKIGLDQEPYYHISYNLIVTIKSGDVQFELEFRGRNYGKEKAKYVHD